MCVSGYREAITLAQRETFLGTRTDHRPIRARVDRVFGRLRGKRAESGEEEKGEGWGDDFEGREGESVWRFS